MGALILKEGVSGNRAMALELAIDELLAAGASVTHVGPEGLQVDQLPLVGSVSTELGEALSARLSASAEEGLANP